MKYVRYSGYIDKFMSAEEALQDILKGNPFQYIYGEFAIKDILSAACKSGWVESLENGIRLVNAIISNIGKLPNYTDISRSKEYREHVSRDDNIYDDMISSVMFVNELLDRISSVYHFYTYKEDDRYMIKVQRDGGIV